MRRRWKIDAIHLPYGGEHQSEANVRSKEKPRSAFCLSREDEVLATDLIERNIGEAGGEGEVNEGHVTPNSSALSRDELRSCDRAERLE